MIEAFRGEGTEAGRVTSLGGYGRRGVRSCHGARLELTEAYPLRVKRSNIIYGENGAREGGVSLKRYVTIGETQEKLESNAPHMRGASTGH